MVSRLMLRYVAKRLPRLSCDGARSYSQKASKPLRILFCGSDEFSGASLRALHAEQQRDLKGILSIDVLCRPGKPSGRSMKKIREVPIKAVAQDLGLNIHERDTFRGWDLPKPQQEPINLIVAVSFGLFVPPRILKSAEYGGLNIHPSLLPNFRGPAPLQHIIMQGVDSTGVTLQTLDDKSFDHGAILAQTQTPVQIEGHDKITYQELLDFVTPLAADMLVKGIRDRIFIPPLPQLNLIQPSNLIYASKITPSDREIDWFDWDTQTIHRRHRALGRLWSITSSSQKSPVRTIFEDFSILEEGTPLFNHLFRRRSNPDENGEGKPWSAFTYMLHMTKQGEIKPLLYVEHGDAIAIPMKRGGVLVRNITVEGKGKRAARKAMESLEVRSFDEDDPQKMICY